ncbi:SWIM zinc finger family protein [Thermoactinospora rubra]|uniref:SWIM zinc finger family protein n=1 Tax=Thermoactinospora rubra TaxID=1088767 RepID=UPI00117C88EB|nr:DUF6880 family protein [Thermoactinospora rubra]
MMAEFSEEDLLALAGSKSYNRGVGYVDAVEDLQADGATICATVYGSEPYDVELTVGRHGLEGSCSCPWGEEGNFCKHCVAVGLVCLREREHGDPVPERFDLRSYLRSLDPGELVDLLVEVAENDRAVRRRLELRAAADPAGDPDAQDLHRLIDRALQVRGYVEWEDSWGYAQAVRKVAGELGRLHRAGRSEAVAALAERAMRRLGENYELVDDSDGQVGEAGRALVAVHAAACAAAGTDPAELASWLLDFQLGEADVPEVSLEDYADALGEIGIDAYGERLRRIWERRLPRGDRLMEEDWLTHALMEEYARARGDVDLLVSVLSRGGDGVAYPAVVETLREAGRTREALEWAERGLAAAEGAYDRRLADFAVAAYTAAGREDDALALRRAQFERERSLAAYQELHALAPPYRWPELRAWALDLLRRDAADPRRVPAGSPLVEVLLWENAAEEAWQAATESGAADSQWARLARLRAATHPAEAIPIYQRLAEAKILVMKREAYAEAADFAAQVKTLCERLGRGDDARAYLTRLRTAHRRKRNLMAEFDRRGL